MGCLKEKSAPMIFEQHVNMKYKYGRTPAFTLGEKDGIKALSTALTAPEKPAAVKGPSAQRPPQVERRV